MTHTTPSWRAAALMTLAGGLAISLTPIAAAYLSIYHLIGAGMNVPRFLALGAAIGWLFRPITGLPRDVLGRIAGSVR